MATLTTLTPRSANRYLNNASRRITASEVAQGSLVGFGFLGSDIDSPNVEQGAARFYVVPLERS